VPAALVYGFIEGLLIQSMIQGTGLALLEMAQQILAPVLVGDKVAATVELTDLKPTSKSGRAVTTWLVQVVNQRGEGVMTYTVKRLLAGRPAS
jgi:acyl dehydratase